MGPMEYGDAVYVPVNEEADLEKNGIAQGYLAERGERCDSRFYQLAIANLLYTDPTGKTNLVQTAGTMEEHMHRWHRWKQIRHGKRMICFFSGMKIGL